MNNNNEAHDIAQTFIGKVYAERINVNLYLTNGVRLEGRITKFDKDALVLSNDVKVTLVNKHAIASININQT